MFNNKSKMDNIMPKHKQHITESEVEKMLLSNKSFLKLLNDNDKADDPVEPPVMVFNDTVKVDTYIINNKIVKPITRKSQQPKQHKVINVFSSNQNRSKLTSFDINAVLLKRGLKSIPVLQCDYYNDTIDTFELSTLSHSYDDAKLIQKIGDYDTHYKFPSWRVFQYSKYPTIRKDMHGNLSIFNGMKTDELCTPAFEALKFAHECWDFSVVANAVESIETTKANNHIPTMIDQVENYKNKRLNHNSDINVIVLDYHRVLDIIQNFHADEFDLLDGITNISSTPIIIMVSSWVDDSQIRNNIKQHFGSVWNIPVVFNNDDLVDEIDAQLHKSSNETKENTQRDYTPAGLEDHILNRLYNAFNMNDVEIPIMDLIMDEVREHDALTYDVLFSNTNEHLPTKINSIKIIDSIKTIILYLE